MPKLSLDVETLKVESFTPVGQISDQQFGSGAQACFTEHTCASGGAICCA